MDDNLAENDAKTVEILNKKLKSAEKKLDNVLNLVKRTFTGNSLAARELSELVGVPAPILCCEDEDSSQVPKNDSQTTYKDTIPVSNSRLASRMEFLNQVMNDHDKMMKQNYQRPVPNKNASTNIRTIGNRAKSADRASRLSEHLLFNPFVWNLNDHVGEINNANVSKLELSSTPGFCHAKPLIQKSAKLRPCTRQNDVKVEQLLFNTENVRMKRYNGRAVPESTDLRPNYREDVSSEKPPKPARPSSSISNKRTSSAHAKQKSYTDTPFHHLNLHPTEDTTEDREKLLDAMEKRFKLSTIDLQRRLGIPEIGMVGP